MISTTASSALIDSAAEDPENAKMCDPTSIRLRN
jgi:hypothetical protein